MFRWMLLATAFLCPDSSFAKEPLTEEMSRIGHLELFNSHLERGSETQPDVTLCACDADEEGDYLVYARGSYGSVMEQSITPFQSKDACERYKAQILNAASQR